MVPSQSRVFGHRRSFGFGLAASASVVGTSPGGLPRAPRKEMLRALKNKAAALTTSSSSNAAYAFAQVVLAGAGFALVHKEFKRARPRAAATAATVEPTDHVPPLIELAQQPPPFEPAGQVGALAPLGYFDPLGCTKTGDKAGFRKLREAELKHARVAMMASVGLVGQHFFRLPGFNGAPAGLAAVYSGEGVLGLSVLLTVLAFMELAWRPKEDKEPGNFGDPFGVNMYTGEMRNKELSNGRFAMICVLGILIAEVTTGKDAMQQLGV